MLTFPSVEEVYKWKQTDVLTYLQSKRDELDLDDDDIDVIEEKEVAGRDFLELNEKKLMKYGLFRGSAVKIEVLVRDIKQGKRKKESNNFMRHFDRFDDTIEKLYHKLDGVEIAWFSAPGTDTGIGKGKFVRSHGTCIDFPFKLTMTTQRGETGKFRDPPGPDLLKTFQEYFINECKSLQSKDSKLVIEKVHSIPLLDTRKPDFIFITKEYPLDALNVVAVGEIRKRFNEQFSDDDVGHAVSFGEKVLQLQPQRTYVYVILTDCRLICIYKVTRCNCNFNFFRFSYEYVLPANLNYESRNHPPDGWRYLVTIMECDQEKLGWVDPSLKFNFDTVKLVRSINTGRTSIVYEGKLNDMDPVVVKLAKEVDYLSCFEREKNVLKNLDNLLHIPKLLLCNENSLVTVPLGTKVKNIQKEDIRNIIETLRTVHSRGIVHMDLRADNLIRDNDEKIVIIDWGYSVRKNEIGEFAGALRCMPDNILESLVYGKQIKYLPSIDLICFVRSLYLMLHRPVMRVDGIHGFRSKAQYVLAFWSSNGKSYLWQKIHQEAKNLNYENLIKELEELF
ncbi:2066_t:CDS:2 [Diversispora eburnea]|uniref:2066_t:CDS:1 n=1 Tax=Diversispora eburnea TaxID=1213867 RepID=A0A9N9A2R9_9GLOM|nr:2066_t:CDS:2 [Diversispora eburnea]